MTSPLFTANICSHTHRGTRIVSFIDDWHYSRHMVNTYVNSLVKHWLTHMCIACLSSITHSPGNLMYVYLNAKLMNKKDGLGGVMTAMIMNTSSYNVCSGEWWSMPAKVELHIINKPHTYIIIKYIHCDYLKSIVKNRFITIYTKITLAMFHFNHFL